MSGKPIALLMLLACCSATAAENEYQCVILEQLHPDSDGKLTRPPRPYLIGERFAVDRVTGVHVGPQGALWTTLESKYTVLARGNADSSFVVVAVAPAGAGGMFVLKTSIQEFERGKRKPFAAASSSQVVSGVCE